VKYLADQGEVRATPDILAPVGSLHICGDLRAWQTVTSVDIEAPKEGQLKTPFTWLSRQLSDAPDELLVEARVRPRQRHWASRASMQRRWSSTATSFNT
jgi:hypothetical protein